MVNPKSFNFLVNVYGFLMIFIHHLWMIGVSHSNSWLPEGTPIPFWSLKLILQSLRGLSHWANPGIILRSLCMRKNRCVWAIGGGTSTAPNENIHTFTQELICWTRNQNENGWKHSSHLQISKHQQTRHIVLRPVPRRGIYHFADHDQLPRPAVHVSFRFFGLVVCLLDLSRHGKQMDENGRLFAGWGWEQIKCIL